MSGSEKSLWFQMLVSSKKLSCSCCTWWRDIVPCTQHAWLVPQSSTGISSLEFPVEQGSPSPGPWTGTGHGLLGTGPHSRRWVAGKQAKLHLYLQLLPITRITTWAPPPVRSAASLDSHRSVQPTLNYACERSRLRAPYENLMPGDLRWSWGGDASAEEHPQIQIIISREVSLHRDHNKSIACRPTSKPYQWLTSENKLRAPTDSALWWVV